MLPNKKQARQHPALEKSKIPDLLCSSFPAADFSLVRVGIF
ncbi:hypothetical protein SLEP1_g52278 [Rubroshorea leprosula]|uniref:Uncharacterized protein n=1 Tax=Rubroshorea leprosula TaxID=152421 RepID=A0AAV5M8F0_9ROSI|nr:hypothetical protein SLEP1_g52278 [Rubroshorea leprosula]